MDKMAEIAGATIKCPQGYHAFIPHPLPPSLHFDASLISALSRADFLLGKLAREGKKLLSPHLLIRPFITREAVLSSQIEGTQASIGEVLIQNANASPLSPDLQEVQNYIKALDYGIKRLKDLPLSLRLIKELHSHLMQGVRGHHATPGEFRRSQNWIGTPGCTLNSAHFVPPPPEYLMECLGDLELFLHNDELPPLIHIASVHYQFEAIHPFIDGNGRIGRLLITLLLIAKERLPSPLLYLSAFFEVTRSEYYRALHNISRKGEWNHWLLYFLNGVALQSEDALSRIERINALLSDWTVKTKSHPSDVTCRIIDHLAANPYLTIKRIAKELHIAYSTAQRGVQKLESFDIIKQINQAKRDKIYCATQILSILEEPSKITSYE